MAFRAPSAAVAVFPGSNGDRDLYEAFERAGFDTRYVRCSDPIPAGTQVLGLPGGFSYGDYWRAGMLASQERIVQELSDFVARGGLVIGICNGFQILVEAGLLPGALRHNDPPGFLHNWVTLVVRGTRESPWTYGIAPGTRLFMPLANGEGSFFHPDGQSAIESFVPLAYQDNPNASLANAASMLDPTGRVFGIMPHPERASDPDLGSTDGLRIFAAAYQWLTEATR